MESPLLDVLAPDERRRLLSMARRRRFGRGEVVFHEGDPGDALHLIDKGHVAVKRTTLRVAEEQGILRISRGRIEVLDRAAVAKHAR